MLRPVRSYILAIFWYFLGPSFRYDKIAKFMNEKTGKGCKTRSPFQRLCSNPPSPILDKGGTGDNKILCTRVLWSSHQLTRPFTWLGQFRLHWGPFLWFDALATLHTGMPRQRPSACCVACRCSRGMKPLIESILPHCRCSLTRGPSTNPLVAPRTKSLFGLICPTFFPAFFSFFGIFCNVFVFIFTLK